MDKTANLLESLKLSVRIFAFSFVALPVGAAWADCKPVIAAYSAADATRHFALYNVDSMTQPPKGEPIRVVIGETDYLENDVRKGALEIVKDGYKKLPFVPGFEAKSVRDDETKGRVRCESLGERKVGAEVLIGYEVRSNDKGNAPDPYANDLWVNKRTGLPAWYGMGSDGEGFRWVYGAQAIAPPANQIKQ